MKPKKQKNKAHKQKTQNQQIHLENAKEIYASFDAKRTEVSNSEKHFKTEQRNLNVAKDSLEKNHQNWIFKMDDQKVKMERLLQ